MKRVIITLDITESEARKLAQMLKNVGLVHGDHSAGHAIEDALDGAGDVESWNIGIRSKASAALGG